MLRSQARAARSFPGGGLDVTEAGLGRGRLAQRWQRGIRRCGAETQDQRGTTVPVVVWMWPKLDWLVADWR